MITVNELPELDVCDGEGVGKNRMGAEEGDSSYKVDVGAILSYSSIQYEELFVANHLGADHVSEGVPADVEGDEVGDVLREEVEDYSVDYPSPRPPDLLEREGYQVEDAVGGHKHRTAHDVDGEEEEDQRGWVLPVLLHKVLDLIRVKVLEQTDEEQNIADDYNGEDVQTKAVRVSCRVQRVVDGVGRILGEERRSIDARASRGASSGLKDDRLSHS